MTETSLSPHSVKMKRFTLRASVAFAVAAVSAWPGETAAQAPVFNACVSYPPQSAGIYSFPTDNYNPTLIKRDVYASGGGIANDNYYFSTRYEELMGIPVVERKSYSLKNWGVEDTYSGKIENVATDLAYFAPRDEAYGCFCNVTGTGYIFAKYKIGSWTYTKIRDLDKALAAMDFSADGTLYAIDWDGMLNIVDKKTGALTPVGDTGVTTQVITGGAIDRSTNTFYYSVKTPDQAAIYTVDLATAAATKLYDLQNQEQVGGLYFPETYADNAPGTPYGNPTVSFSGTEMTGTVKFRAPRTNYDGSPATGTVTYHVLANGQEIATGQGEYGSTAYITADVTLTAPDLYCFSVYFENEAGRGPRTKTSQYVGADIPKAPINPRLTYTGGVVKLFWNAAGSLGVNGGNIDRTDFHYLVTRYPDGETYTCEQSPFQQEIQIPDQRVDYHYTIQTVAGQHMSEAAVSPSFGLGAITPPYAEDFAKNTSSFGFSSINPDGSPAWEYDGGMKGVSNMAPADNYLVTPPFTLKGGSSYEVTVSLKRGNNRYNETFSLTAGTEASAQGLGELTIIPSTEISTDGYQTYTGTLAPAHDGRYHIALHAESPEGRYMIVNGLTVAKGVAKSAPGAVADLEAHPDMTGAHNVSFSFVTPTQTLDQTPLDEITTVRLMRDDTVIKTVSEGVTPGMQMTMTDDTEPEAGIYDYTVVCDNSAGTGTPATISVVIGFNYPEETEKVSVVETEDPGVVTLTWLPVTHDIDGKTFNEGAVTYNLYNREKELVKGGLSETTYTVRAGEPNIHTWAQYTVQAVSERGASEGTKSMLVPVGRPDPAPWRESFANKEVTYPIGTTHNYMDDQWQIVGGFHSEYTGIDIDPVDNDGGMMGLDTPVTDEKVSLFTGNIDLSPTPLPALSFWVFNYIGSNGLDNANRLTVQVCPRHEPDFTTVRTLTVSETGPRNQWNKVTVPLTDYEGQVVRLRIQAEVVTAIYMHLDNLVVNTLADNNLAARDITAPESVNPGEEFEISFTVTNTGETVAGNYLAELLLDGEVIDSKEGGQLAAGEKHAVTFRHSLPITAKDANIYQGRVNFTGDQVEADNTTPSHTVLLRRNALPSPVALGATNNDNAVVLTWSAPDLSTPLPAAATETFDNAQGWTSAVDGWTFLDLDRATIGGIGKKEIPVSGQQSFFLINDTHKALNNPNDGTRFKAHSGNQYMCSMYSMRGQTYVQSDDWAISPELSGSPQTISLWASSFEADPDQTQYLETFEILASTTGTDPEDFSLIKRFEEIAPAWKRYEAYLPAGTRHFAIRGVSYDKYMLFVDDVEFIAADGAPQQLSLTGYNIWRDGAKLATVDAAATSYTDNSIEGGKTYKYAVNAVYGTDESTPCDEIEVMTSIGGLDILSQNGIRVVTTPGKIKILGADGLDAALYSVDGKTNNIVTCTAVTEITTTPGIYLLHIGDNVTKVVVR